MPRQLDARFAVIVSFLGEGSNVERAAARESADEVARACGYTFAEAMAELRRPAGMATPEVDDEAKVDDEAAVDPPAEPPPHLSTPLDARITAALAADPSRADRAIARDLQCSPTIVGRARAAAGLARPVRIVRRGGQAYEMRRAGTGPSK